MKAFKKIITILIIVAVLADTAASLVVYNLAITRSNKDFLLQYASVNQALPSSSLAVTSGNTDTGTNINYKSAVSASTAKIDWFDKKSYEEVSITSYDGLKLKGYFLKAKVPTTKTVILAHGYSSQGIYMAPYAEFYYEQYGYNVLMPDDRGHGDSEGNYIGFGWIDRKDYMNWIDYIINRIGQDSQIVLHGVSMGGSAVLMTSGETLPENVKAIVSDCAYTSVKDELAYQLKKMYNLPPFPILGSASLLTKILAGYSFEEGSALKQVSKSKTPILFIHGTGDRFVPFYMVTELYEACSSEKELFTVLNAGHGAAYTTDPDKYIKKVGNFIEKHVN
jgi:fermentation-respiration switch protein FrsA (DUF1100 family)